MTFFPWGLGEEGVLTFDRWRDGGECMDQSDITSLFLRKILNIVIYKSWHYY